MKAREVPDRLYFGESDKGILDIYSTKESNDEIEYARTDAFIEKACEWLIKELINFEEPVDTEKTFIQDFRKYMEE